MAARRDYYQVLGVPRDADAKTIKGAFRRLARRYHPDTSTDPDAEQRFREIAEAYGVLSDPARRASYDAHGFAGLAGASAEDLWGGIDLADILGPGMPGFKGLPGQPECDRDRGRPAAAQPAAAPALRAAPRRGRRSSRPERPIRVTGRTAESDARRSCLRRVRAGQKVPAARDCSLSPARLNGAA